MIETIILSISAFFIGILVGASLMYPFGRIKSIKLKDGKSIHMWKGFVDQSTVFVSIFDENSLQGDTVVYNDKGNIIQVIKNVEEG